MPLSKKEFRYKVENEGSMIINEGMIFYIVNGKKHIQFFNNVFGRKLKKMWKQLNKPIRGKKKWITKK